MSDIYNDALGRYRDQIKAIHESRKKIKEVPQELDKQLEQLALIESYLVGYRNTTDEKLIKIRNNIETFKKTREIITGAIIPSIQNEFNAFFPTHEIEDMQRQDPENYRLVRQLEEYFKQPGKKIEQNLINFIIKDTNKGTKSFDELKNLMQKYDQMMDILNPIEIIIGMLQKPAVTRKIIFNSTYKEETEPILFDKNILNENDFLEIEMAFKRDKGEENMQIMKNNLENEKNNYMKAKERKDKLIKLVQTKRNSCRLYEQYRFASNEENGYQVMYDNAKLLKSSLKNAFKYCIQECYLNDDNNPNIQDLMEILSDQSQEQNGKIRNELQKILGI